jgi:hypothetical protein
MRNTADIFPVIFCIVLFGCTTKSSPEYQNDFDAVYEAAQLATSDVLKEVWICYHPNTKYHDKICVEDFYPDGCYVQGSKSHFCWKLTKQMCDSYEVDKKFCELLKEKYE